jgi:Siphovirus Gp157
MVVVMRLDLTLAQISSVMATLKAAQVDDDEKLVTDAIEGETDAYEVLGSLLRQHDHFQALANGAKANKTDVAVRQARFEAKVEAFRSAMLSVVEMTGLDKITLPQATISMREIKAKLVLVSPEAVPNEFCKHVPDLEKIKAQYSPGEVLPNWLATEPERKGITVRKS